MADAVMAVAVGSIMILSSLMLTQQTLMLYQYARDMQTAAMVGRLVMEEARRQESMENTYAFYTDGRAYTARIRISPVDIYYKIYQVEVTDPHGRIYRFKRLAPIGGRQ
ncbi:hypothetical protein SAMN05660900_00180 [Megasphaera cerevisiae DSM 20462]|nr:hypothetical protein SAMN05660900_00180 [Megasphaera cerevisiae DSM 20462]